MKIEPDELAGQAKFIYMAMMQCAIHLKNDAKNINDFLHLAS